MLSRALILAAVALMAAGLALALPVPALAGGGPGGGGPFGTVQCGQSFTPSCVATAGSPATATAPSSGGLAAGSTTAAGCAGTVSKPFGCVPPGCQVSVATLMCPLTVAGPAPAGGPPPAAVLAQLARSYLALPTPAIVSSPPAGVLQLTGLPVWLWVNRAMWAPRSATAAVPGERVSVTATPVALTWQMGDGAVVACRGPGTPYTSRYSPSAPSPDCGHTYTWPSAAQPRGAYRVTATITWAITWQAGAAAGTLPALASATTTALRVGESPALNTTGGA
jgi:hypothetical protein